MCAPCVCAKGRTLPLRLMIIFTTNHNWSLSSWLTWAVRWTRSLTWHFNRQEIILYLCACEHSTLSQYLPTYLPIYAWSQMYFCTSSSSKLVRSQACFRHICRLFQCSRKQAATRRLWKFKKKCFILQKCFRCTLELTMCGATDLWKPS